MTSDKTQFPPITFDVAIIGGGPGGLMTAMHINQKVGDEAKITIFEQSNRLGGKLMTGKFEKADALYEIGVAEIYDYDHLGHDPLKHLITQTLGLEIQKMDSECVIIDDKIMNNVADIEKLCGRKTKDAIVSFRKKCASVMTTDQYFEGVGRDDNDHPWMFKSGLDVIHDEIKDEMARRYVRINAHSDIAIGPNETSGLNALKNFLMDYDEYIQYYCVEGGNERIAEKLAEIVRAEIALYTRVRRIGRTEDGRYRLTIIGRDGKETTRDFDFVVVSLPYNWLQTIEWEGEGLYRAMGKHLDLFNVPAHYLRVAISFEERFWDKHVEGSWWMSDHFNGHCVYIESTRYDYGSKRGGLNWLIAGSDALALANLPDDHLIRMALESLPAQMRDAARKTMIEGKVHRWLNTVNGIPGGRPVRDTQVNHQPEPKLHPGLFVTGDYLFDATVNGVLDSADCASDMLMSEYVQRDYEERIRRRTPGGKAKQASAITAARNINRQYFENYWQQGPYAEVWDKFFNAEYLRDAIRLAFGEKAEDFSILDAGSASGQTVGALRKLGLKAQGVEKNAWIHEQTPKALMRYNTLGDVTDLPFKDNQFDYIYETCLANLPRHKVVPAIEELHRVAKKGVILGSVTSDLSWDSLITMEQERGVKTFGTLWQWSDWFFNVGFEHATEDPKLLERLYQRAAAAGFGKGRWFEDAESMGFVFFRKIPD
jgi:monoamine oxidase/SAM-dependent methyltransferase